MGDPHTVTPLERGDIVLPLDRGGGVNFLA